MGSIEKMDTYVLKIGVLVSKLKKKYFKAKARFDKLLQAKFSDKLCLKKNKK